ncbi:fluoride efflux transporter CrcB [Candidatus Methylocalor cossyra]|uniref:Fluoride-specific ion channel FluC n=1 Tax=Candidatus Methylocalor cossyra TaxID=3108543 RepID=A0ABM9NHM6_9GAMM
MKLWLVVALGGSAGALARFWVANGVYAWLGRSFPVGTLVVNVSGCFLMGLLTELLLQRFPLASGYRAGILVGFLGAYTTFSSFAIETLSLVEAGGLGKAAVNVLLSVVLCLAAVWFGLVIGRRLFSAELYPWWGHGLAYGKMAAVLASGILWGLVAELAFRPLAAGATLRAVTVMGVLCLMTVGSTVIALPNFPETRAGTGMLLGLFAASALGSVLSVGLGMAIGRQL